MDFIDVIVPVYDGFSDTKNCLISLSESLKQNDIRCNVIVINDKSPNQELTHWLRDFATFHDFQLIENETNLGFVATVNKGMSANTNSDVILLNSDTIVANNWIDRMVDCAYSNPKAGTITPVSNNATICSFPNFCKENPLPQMSVSQLDDVFASANYGCSVKIPTGVGFCMLITRECLKETGFFNEEAFGKGYGEENDFCIRAAEKGWDNIFCLDTYIAHVGSVSFSSKKQALVDKAMVTLEELHPGYHQLTEAHIKTDPAKIFRMRAYLDMLQQSTLPNILLISHNLGGGVETHIQELMQVYQNQANFLVLKCKKNQTYVLSLGELDDLLNFEIPEQYEDLVNLLSAIGLSKIHIHHTMGLDPTLWKLGQSLDILMDYTIHDFYLINGNPTLTNKKGYFCSEIETRDELCTEVYPLPCDGGPEVWRSGVRDFLNKCHRIILPSLSAAEIFQDYYPEYDFTVAYHPDSELSNYPAPVGWELDKKTLNILTLGAISQVKGANLLEQTAKIAQENNLPIQFHLLGYAYRPLHHSITNHGPYQPDTLDKKLTIIKPDLIWLPALWPETYSYTLSESLFAGTPVVVPDIGAFPERVAGRPWAQIYPWNSSPEFMIDLFSKLKAEGISQIHDRSISKIDDHLEHCFYAKYYLPDAISARKPNTFYINDEWLEAFSAPKELDKDLTSPEKLLVKMFHFRDTTAGRVLSQMIPIQFQRKLKKWLSQKPIHELTS